MQIKELGVRLAEQSIDVELMPKARSYFIEHGYEPAFGARPMRRLIQREIEDVLASKIIAGECACGDTALIDAKKTKAGDVLNLRIKKRKPALIDAVPDAENKELAAHPL